MLDENRFVDHQTKRLCLAFGVVTASSKGDRSLAQSGLTRARTLKVLMNDLIPLTLCGVEQVDSVAT